MCMKCLEVARELFPNETDVGLTEILWNYTPFPFGTPKMIREQLEHLKEVGFDQVDQEIAEMMKHLTDEDADEQNVLTG